MLKAEGLRKSFQGVEAVRGIDLTVATGEVVGFLGPNGAGKSTTMRMIAGFLDADAGRASIAGHDVVEERIAAQSALGYLPEGAPSHGAMTPLEYLRFIAEVRDIPKVTRGEVIDTIVEDVRLTTVLHKPVDTLSKGYRRRVGLAAAMIHRPPVLILDEPTDGLDPNQKDVVRALIRERAKDTAILISTHILEEVPAVCSRVVLVSGGQVIADDTPEGLAARSAGKTLEAAFREFTRIEAEIGAVPKDKQETQLAA